MARAEGSCCVRDGGVVVYVRPWWMCTPSPFPHPCATAWRCRDVGCILLESITSSNLALGVDGSWFRLALSNVRPPFSFPLSTFWPFFSLRLALPPHYLFFQPTIFFPLSSSVVLTVSITLNSGPIQSGQPRYTSYVMVTGIENVLTGILER